MTRTKSLLLLILALASTPLAADERLRLLQNISSAGAPGLSLKMLDQAQPKIDQDLYQWIAWEQERLAILIKWRQWDRLLVRLESLPADLPLQFKRQAATHKARAFLELEQNATAREILRQQLWQSDISEAAEYEVWRRQVIESYLGDGRFEDARVAMLRFDQDFDADDLAWLLLRARVLIESGRDEQAVEMLRGENAWQARLTSAYAAFRLGRVDKGELWQQIKQRSEAEDLAPGERATLWALAYYAAQRMAPVDRVVALESLFRGAERSPLQLFQLPADRLWQAYLEYAELVGNRSEFLRGDDAKWHR